MTAVGSILSPHFGGFPSGDSPGFPNKEAAWRQVFLT